MTFKENKCFWLRGNTSHSHIFPCNLYTQKIVNTTLCNHQQDKLSLIAEIKKVLICTYTLGRSIQDIHEHINNIPMYTGFKKYTNI